MRIGHTASQDLGIGVERNSIDLSKVSRKTAEDFSRSDIPNEDHFVTTTRSEFSVIVCATFNQLGNLKIEAAYTSRARISWACP